MSLHVDILAKTQNSITVGWNMGINDDYTGHFKVLYREKSKKYWQESQDIITSLKAGQSINYTVYGLYAKKEYEITVVAVNQFNSSCESSAAVQTVITEGKTSWPTGTVSCDHITHI